MSESKRIFISSSTLALPEHRREIMDASLRQGIFPIAIEATPADSVTLIMKSIDQADIYLGVYAHRYGYVPKEDNPKQVSLLELEYDYAVRREIPRLIFVMDKTHPIKINEVEMGSGQNKLEDFLVRINKENIVGFFNSPEELRTLVANSLFPYREKDLKTLHSGGDIPSPPEKYIAHPYTLLQTHGLVGREKELNLLTEWAAKPGSDIFNAHILSIVAMGGMGKSALTWKWFNDIAPEEMKPLVGQMWWSFYESDASFENFIIRALAYVSKRSIEEVRRLHPEDRETQLFTILDREKFLLVLDGLERILIAYARMDAAYLSDSDYDRATANYVADAYGLPPEAAKSFTGEHRLRKAADPRAGAFLRKLSRVRAARILISTRLYPFDLQRGDALPLPGCHALFLPGLSNDDALNLWRSFNVSGSQDQLLPIFNRVGNHALLLQALASEVANYRPAPRDFEKWRKANPDFDPAKYPHLQDAMGHVLEYALRGLGDNERSVLQTIAGFRMPTGYDTLSAVLTWADAHELDRILTELEDRGLVGWDKGANRYDIHPIVRGLVWSSLGDEAKQGVYSSLHAHFEAVPIIENWRKVESLEDLTPAIELYSTLIGMGRYEDAYIVFRDRLDNATLYRLSASRQRAEMLEMLFPDGTEKPPRLSKKADQAYTLSSLATGYLYSGMPGRTAPLYRLTNKIVSKMDDSTSLGIGLENLSATLRVIGKLHDAETTARQALKIVRKVENHFLEAVSLYWLGLVLAGKGESNDSASALRRSLNMFLAQKYGQSEGVVNAYLAQRAIWFGEYKEARLSADRAWELASTNRNEGDFVRSARLMGEAAMVLDDLETADERLHHALTRARAVNHIEEELQALSALAELRRRQGDEKAGREFLDDVWENAERGPYPLFHADALNVLAQIERDAGNTDKAIEAATKAYQLSWCDGPPYAYHWGLVKAQKHLEELGAPLPDMPAFDESKYEPMPEVEIDPDDEFHVGDSS